MKKFFFLITLFLAITIILIPKNSSANISTFNVSVNEKTCQQIGMIANDASQDINNYKLLCNELKAGTRILVDDKYYISGAKSAMAITKNISIEGLTDTAEFSFTNNRISYLFDIQAKEISLKKVKLTTVLFNGSKFINVFNIKDSHKINNFVIENCYFEGSIKLIIWTFKNRDYKDPTTTDYGITNFSFSYNTCKNLRNSFIEVSNVPIHYSKLIGNNINNFSYIFYNQDISISNPYTDKVAELMSYLEVRDNIVINDSSWNGAPKDQIYHCFVYFDGNKCDYYNNHVEGLHVISQSTVVYDAYLSCIELDYENNYWKNNINFSPLKTNCELMKSKFAHKSDYHGIKRVYKNNTYIIEKSYADIMGRPYDELWVSLGRVEREIDTLVIENNKIDVYKLRMNETQYVHNYTFNNNKIHAYAVQDIYHNCILPVSKLDHPSSADTYIARNNKITIDTPRFTNKKQNSLIRLGGKNNEMKHVKILFENNYVSWPDLDSLISSVYGSSTIIKDVKVTNNTIITTRPVQSTGKTLYSGIYSQYSELVFDNNFKAPTTISTAQ